MSTKKTRRLRLQQCAMAEYSSASCQTMCLSLLLNSVQYSWQLKSLKPLIEKNFLILVVFKPLEIRNRSNLNTQEILIKLYHLVSSGISISFIWIPSLIGIHGNTAADRAAKLAVSSTITDSKVSCSDFKPLMNKYMISQWQVSWNRETGNKLYSITPEVDMSNITMGLLRREELVIHRACIGHTHLTYSNLLKGEDTPVFIRCDCPLTVECVLISCIDFSTTREKNVLK
jgi:hypothetical protein